MFEDPLLVAREMLDVESGASRASCPMICDGCRTVTERTMTMNRGIKRKWHKNMTHKTIEELCSDSGDHTLIYEESFNSKARSVRSALCRSEK